MVFHFFQMLGLGKYWIKVIFYDTFIKFNSENFVKVIFEIDLPNESKNIETHSL